MLIGDEAERPYERPPLSKAYLMGTDDKAKLYVHDEGWYRENSVEVQLGRRVTNVDRAGHQVQMEGGERVGHQQAVAGYRRVPASAGSTGCRPGRGLLPAPDRLRSALAQVLL